MKRNKHFRAFARGFVRAGCMMFLMFIVGFITYKLTIGVYRATHKEGNQTSARSNSIANDGTADNICKNLIYITDEEENIQGIVLEILNSYTNNLDYITIPSDTQFSLSTELYQKLYAKNEQIPQIISLKNLNTYFDAATRFGYGKLIVNELLGTELSCYTIINSDTADSIFKEETRTIVLQTGDLVEGFVYVLTDSILESVNENESYSMKEYLARFYEVAKSNLPLESKQKYASTYRNVNSDYIYYHIIPGVQESEYYDADIELTKEFITQLVNNEAYEITQDAVQDADPISSVGLRISLLNGSKITGLASRYSGIIRNAGFSVGEVGNYSGSVLQDTKIIVTDAGMGRDLISLFQNATIEVGDVPEGFDIQIILGVSENR
ncbi:LytR C-terminal domain-containing protein [Anaerosporobacter sp.]|uniref:LytR C-terminal domain-containing protein n=1 Tax=Anaerosporobacter sp. TaxID=1872529 RepID=UPI00286F7939|nr:LytR C-terminal domain-containing protein [Anaerosporobacter sp.]